MRLTFLLIGQDSLLIQCGNVLLEKNHEIKWVVSQVASIQNWCEKHNIPCLPTLNELPGEKKQSVDYLFSIVNGKILTKEDLQIARYASINYHDSLLPKYAGVHATTWSILNNETFHGITWHLINEGIDEGDIVYQNKFPIANNETVLTLNLRCFEAAVKGFSDILQKIESSSLNTLKQQKESRSYYGLSHVLPDMGFINWNKANAEDVIQCYRALNFGNYTNNVGLLKLYLNQTFLIVMDVALSTYPCSIQQGGVVLAIENEGLIVSTLTQPIVIKKIITPMGASVTPKELIETYDIKVNSHLPQISPQIVEENTPVYKKALTHEQYWLKQLISSTEHGFFSDRMFEENGTEKKLSPIRLNTASTQLAHSSEVYLLASIMIYLYRINNYESFTVFWHQPQGLNTTNLFSNLLPISAHDFQSDLKIGEIIELVSQKLNSIRRHGTYLNDIYMRQPSLTSIVQEAKKYVITVGTERTENSLIHFGIQPDSDEINIAHYINSHYQGGTVMPVLENMSAHINTILQIMCSEPNLLVHQFSFLEQDEHAQLLEWSIGEYRPLPSNTITDLFEQRVKFSPEKTVLFENNTPLSYYQLWLEAESISSYLQSLQLPHQSAVSFSMVPSATTLALMLGILKAGHIGVPITPGTFIEESVANYKAETLLDHKPMSQNLTVYSSNLSVGKQECLRFYTPQSVCDTLNQKQIINYSYWYANTVGLNEHSLLNVHTSVPFNLLMMSMLSSIIVGGTLDFNQVTACREDYLDHLRTQNITHLRISAEEWEFLLDYPELVSQLKSLRYIVLTNTVSHTDQIIEWRALNSQSRFIVIS
ncbi:formyltransferase family protein [Legionella quateirensis]|uniref:Peptide synthetase, non-ribosomal n=1 Tax=Legionella quateirensis TaxID=45072 RepID=A0A378KRZ4_9GAMM|nr:formyltransferase family protein [Legionella quateirensis]KTD43670.1 peptide synthetase, non-ribosomal [Legionella quateirensis]STY17342.1 peptide synthetase, non-ribosomal [Legionella quateirensis]